MRAFDEWRTAHTGPTRSTGSPATDAPHGLLRILQLTDPHLFGDPRGQLLGVTTLRSFEAVLELALSRSPTIDALVLTGDLVHDGSVAGYRRLRHRLDRTGYPYYCIPGNHDSRLLMKETLGAAALGPVEARRIGHWNLVFIDSTQPGQESGRLGPDRLIALRHRLEADPAPAILFVHQHPVPVDSAWMDRLAILDGAELLALGNRYPWVRALVCGHIHQEMDLRRGRCRILGTPSTCVQFAPGRDEFALDTRGPGYREIQLADDGSILSNVIRLEGYPERATAAAVGY